MLHTATAANATDSVVDGGVSQQVAASTVASVPDFEPTHEWQAVQAGQAIPPGLWVRIDMTTGEKTARLLPTEEEEEQSNQAADGQTEQLQSAGLVIVPAADSDAPGEAYEDDEVAREREADAASESYSTRDDDAPISVTVLSNAEDAPAGTLAATALDLPPSTFSTPTPAQLSALKLARAARLREIAEAFQPTDDLAIIKQLLSIVMKGGSPGPDEGAVGVDGVLQAMELLESLVHQVDNAADFVALGGLDMVLQMLDASSFQRSLPSSLITNQQQRDEQAGQEVSEREQAGRLAALQEKAAWLLGTAAQNNPTVKKEAMKEQTIHILLQLLRHTQSEVQRLDDSDGTDDEMTDAWRRVQAKSLYALSSLLRSFAAAQDEFHQRQGGDGLLSLLTANAPSSSLVDKQQHTVYHKTVALLSDLVQDRLINDINASSSVLFDQLTDNQWCAVFGNLTLHTTPLLQRAASPSTSQSSALSFLKTTDVILGIVDLLTKHQLCVPTFSASSSFRTLVEQQAVQAGKARTALTAEDDSRHFWYQQILNKLQAIAGQLPSSAAFSTSASSSSVNDSASTHSGLSLLGVPLVPCSSAPLTGYHRDSFCSHNPNDGGRHLVCALLSDAFLQYSKSQGNDLITPRGSFGGLRSGDKWCVCVARWQEALQAGVAPGVLLEATNARAGDMVSRQALLNHAVVDGLAETD